MHTKATWKFIDIFFLFILFSFYLFYTKTPIPYHRWALVEVELKVEASWRPTITILSIKILNGMVYIYSILMVSGNGSGKRKKRTLWENWRGKTNHNGCLHQNFEWEDALLLYPDGKGECLREKEKV